MTETQFLQLVQATLAEVEATVDDADVDADCALSGAVLTIELRGGAQIVINAQTPLRQLWMASHAGAMHFAFDGTHWRDLRGGTEFFAALADALSRQASR